MLEKFTMKSIRRSPAGQRRSGKGRDQGFSLIELMIVVAIIGALALIMVPYLRTFITKSKSTRCIAEIRGLQFEISSYLIDRSSFPASLADIKRDTLKDPFGNPYQYKYIAGDPLGLGRLTSFALPLNDDYDLYSLGPDGASAQGLDDPTSQDDIVRAVGGGYIGLGKEF